MTFSHPEIERVFDTAADCVPTLVIEEQSFLLRLLTDIYEQTCGSAGKSVLGKDQKIVDFARHAELLTSFVPFEINRKPLLTKIMNVLETQATAPALYERTMRLLSDIEQYLYDLAFDQPCDIQFTKVSVPALLRNAGLELRDDYPSLGEKLLDYMELVTEYDREKLFITVDLRAFIPDEQAATFMASALSHGYHLLMLESAEHTLLPCEQRTIIDRDLCEIG